MVAMWIRRSGLVVALITALLLLGGASQGAAADGEPQHGVPYDICEFFPWWPGCI